MQLQQQELFVQAPAWTEQRLVSYLREGWAGSLELTLTRNRVSMASVHFLHPEHIVLRLHERFLEAPESVVRALRTFAAEHHDSPVGQRARRLDPLVTRVTRILRKMDTAELEKRVRDD